MSTAERIRVMVADDEEPVRDVLQALLGSEPQMELVAMAADTESAIELAARNRPDVALVDVHMPGGGGPRATREILRRSPPTKVIALSAHEDVDTVLKMLRAGALAFIVKSDSTDEILWTVQRAYEDRNSVSEHLALPVASAIIEHLESRRSTSRRRQFQRERVERVIQNREFTMVYQPIVDLETNAVVGLEALARFPSLPRRASDVWIAEAAAVGLLVDLDLALARTALEDLGRVPADAYLSMNLSPETAVSEGFVELLEGVDAGRLVIEMTEHSPIDDYDELKDALREPRARGVRVAVDDAGAGFASLRHIVRLEPDLIKLDVTLTHDIHVDPVRQALAVALVSFAEQIGAGVVAEGVESEGQLQALRNARVSLAQGYYLGKPSPIREDDGVKSQGATSR